MSLKESGRRGGLSREVPTLDVGVGRRSVASLDFCYIRRYAIGPRPYQELRGRRLSDKHGTARQSQKARPYKLPTKPPSTYYQVSKVYDTEDHPDTSAFEVSAGALRRHRAEREGGGEAYSPSREMPESRMSGVSIVSMMRIRDLRISGNPGIRS